MNERAIDIWSGRLLTFAACCLLAALFFLLPAAAAGADSVPTAGTASFDGCQNQFNFVPASMERARQRVPAHYTLRSDTEGKTANLLVDLFRCESVTVAGTVLSNVSMAAVALEVAPDAAEHWPADNNTPDDSTDDPLLQDFYLLFLVTDSKPLADWWRADTGLAAYVADIRYEVDELSGRFSFVAPPPTPSPFTVDGVAREQSVVPVFADENRWQDTTTPDGKPSRVKLTFPFHKSYVGPAEVTVTAESVSEMESLMLTNPATPALVGSARFEMDQRMDHLDQVKTVTPRSCTTAERDAQLRDAQQQVLQLLRPSGVDLTVLENEADLAALAALGYDFYPHQQVSFKGVGWSILDGLPPQDPVDAKPLAGRPSLLQYAPTPPQGHPVNTTVTDPRDGFDFPYRLAGWAYVFPFTFGQHPDKTVQGQSFLPCVEREEWFVHERGVHPFSDGGVKPIPPEEEVHGTAPGDVPEPESPGDLPHGRFWDLKVWVDPDDWLDGHVDGDDIPTLSMVNPGEPIPGIDSHVGSSPPTSAEPNPWFYKPQRAADLAVTQRDDPDPVQLGEKARVTYTVTVTNHGPGRATGVTLRDELPRHADRLSVVPGRGSCTQTKTTVTCNLGTLLSGESAQVRIVVRPRTKGTITNTASARASEIELKEQAEPSRGWTTEDAMADNVAGESTTVLAPAAP